MDESRKVSPCAFLVRDDDIKKGYNSNFVKYLKENNFISWLDHGYYDGIDFMFININKKVYAFGMPGIKLTCVIGDHAITIDQFKSIYNMYKEYDNLKPLEFKKRIKK